MTDKVNCPICIKIIIDLAFAVEGAAKQSTQAKDCPRCGKRWALMRNDDPKIEPAPKRKKP